MLDVVVSKYRHLFGQQIGFGPVTALVVVLLIGLACAEECGHDELIQCAKPLQVISATSELSFVTNKEELDQICPDLNAGLHCIRSYTRRCMSIQQRDHFNKLYRGTSEVIHELCTESPYQEDFLRHAPCLRLVKQEYEGCATAYQATMAQLSQNLGDDMETVNATMLEAFQAERIKTVCCAFRKYVHCSESTVQRSCGTEPAKFTRKFLDKMASSLMTMHCDGYDSESSTDKCGLNAFNSGRKNYTISWFIVLPVLFTMQLIHQIGGEAT